MNSVCSYCGRDTVTGQTHACLPHEAAAFQRERARERSAEALSPGARGNYSPLPVEPPYPFIEEKPRVEVTPVPALLMEGRKDDAGKPRMDLLPGDALLDVAAVLEYGARKYAERNWEKGMNWGRLVGALLRHLFAWMNGQDKDPESGLPHLSHMACCALMLTALVDRGVGKDDRKGGAS